MARVERKRKILMRKKEAACGSHTLRSEVRFRSILRAIATKVSSVCCAEHERSN